MKMNVAEFEIISKDIFAPIYPVIAEHIKQNTKITKGTCVDLGSGTGSLGLSLAEITNLEVILFDVSQEMIDISNINIQKRGMSHRVSSLNGDVHALPFDDKSQDLVVSRGSVFFWKDQKQALNEVYRVLAPGGRAYIGGGFGSTELKNQITNAMRKQDEKWEIDMEKRMGEETVRHFSSILKTMEVSEYSINNDDCGMWIDIRKAL